MVFKCSEVDKSVQRETARKSGLALLELLVKFHLDCLEEIRNNGRDKFPKAQEEILFGKIKAGIKDLKGDLVRSDVKDLKLLGISILDYQPGGDVGLNQFLVKAISSLFRSISEEVLKSEASRDDPNLATRWTIRLKDYDSKLVDLDSTIESKISKYLELRRDIKSLDEVCSAIESFKKVLEKGSIKEKRLALQTMFQVVGEYLKSSKNTLNLSPHVVKLLKKKGLPIESFSNFRDMLLHYQMFSLIDLDGRKIKKLFEEALLPIEGAIKDTMSEIEKGFIEDIVKESVSEIKDNIIRVGINSAVDQGVARVIKYIEQIKDKGQMDDRSKEIVDEIYQNALKMKSKEFSVVGRKRTKEKVQEEILKAQKLVIEFIEKNKLKPYDELRDKLFSKVTENHKSAVDLDGAHSDALRIAKIMDYLRYGGDSLPDDVTKDFLKMKVLEKMNLSKDVPLKGELEKYFDAKIFETNDVPYSKFKGDTEDKLIGLLKKGKSNDSIKKLIDFFELRKNLGSKAAGIFPDEYKRLVDGSGVSGIDAEKLLSYSVDWRKGEIEELLKRSSPALKKIYDDLLTGRITEDWVYKNLAYHYRSKGKSGDDIKRAADFLVGSVKKQVETGVEGFFLNKVKEQCGELKELTNPGAIKAQIINLYSSLERVEAALKKGEKGQLDIKLKKLRNYLAHDDVLLSSGERILLEGEIIGLKDSFTSKLGDSAITVENIKDAINSLKLGNSASQITKLLCPSRGGPARARRSASESCLTWEEIDKLSEVEAKDRNPENIMIDSEKLVPAILDEFKMNAKGEKIANLLTLANEGEIVGKYRAEIDLLFGKSGYLNHLNKVGKVSGMVMHGMIAKNIVGDLLRGDYQDVVINLGFIAGNQGLAKALEALSMKGAAYTMEGRVLLGGSMRFAAPVLSRVTSAFIAYDLYNQIKEYQKGNKDALVPIIGDSIQLGVDTAVLGVEIGEGLGIVALEGASAAAGPIGMAIAAVVFVGTEVYAAVRAVEKIDEEIHLTGWERLGQGLLNFFGQRPSEYIEKLMGEKEANNKAVENAISFLKSNSHIRRYVFPGREPVTYVPDHVIYERDVSRLYDKQYSEEALNSIVLLDQKRNDIKWARARPDNFGGVNLFCLPKGEWESVPKGGTYYCENAIGVEYDNNRTGDLTLINLGGGKDRAVGFQDSGNLFILNERHKEIFGGNKNDNFIFEKENVEISYDIAISGSIDGRGGVDTIDVGQLPLNYTYIREGRYQVFADFREGILTDKFKVILNISNINQFLGRKGGVDLVSSACDTAYIDGRGGENRHYADNIVIPRNDTCFYDTKVMVSPYTHVTSNAIRGNFTYVVQGEKGKEAYVDLGQSSQSNNKFIFNYTLQDLAIIDRSNENITFSFKEKEGVDADGSFNLTINGNYKNITTYQLTDNARIVVSQSNIYAMQDTKRPIGDLVKGYYSMAGKSQMYVIVHSNNEVLTIGNTNSDVLSNDPSARASHLVGGSGENVYVVISGHEKLALENLPISDVIIYDFDEENKIDTLDLRKINEQAKKDLNKAIDTEIKRVGSDLLVSLFVDNKSKKEVLKVRLKGALENDWYKRVHAVMDSIYLIEKVQDGFKLTPQPLVLNDRSKTIYVINPDDVARGNKIEVNREIGEYVFARENDALLITNSLASHAYENNFFTLMLNDFYHENNNGKMHTLKVEFLDKVISLSERREEIKSSLSFSELMDRVRVNTHKALTSAVMKQRMFDAIERNDVDKVRELIDHGANVNSQGYEDRAPVCYAVEVGNLDMVRLLIDNGADVNARDDENKTSLHWAAHKGYLDMVKYLISKEADIGAKANGGRTPLHYAAQEGKLDVVKYLVWEKHADINARDSGGQTPLDYATNSKNNNVVEYLKQAQLDLNNELSNAVVENNIDKVKESIRRGADVNTKVKNGRTPLHYAAQEGKLDVVKYLVEEKHADVNANDNDGFIPLHYAAAHGNLRLVKYMVEKGADFNAKCNRLRTPLHLAAMYGYIEVVKYLKERGAAFNLKGHYGQSPLHSATINGKLEVVKYLVKEGASIDDKDQVGRTPLDYATKKGYKNIVEFLKQKQSRLDLSSEFQNAINEGNLDVAESLVDEGADVNVANGSGQTILHFAAGSDDLELVKRLLDKGASVNSTDAVMESPLHYAVAEGGNLEIVKLLVDKGANVNAKNIFSRTPLHLATIVNRLNLVQHLVERGADFNLSDRYGDTPLSFATKQEYSDTVKYLEMAMREKGAVRRRRHHHGYHNLHHSHLSRKLLAEGSSKSREAVAGSSIRPSSWINNFFSWVNRGTGKVKGFIGGWITDNNADLKPENGEKALKMDMSAIDASGAILLLDTLIRRANGQKHTSNDESGISEQEAYGYAVNITEGFEKIIEETAQSSKISMSQFNIDFPKVQGEVTKKIISGKYSEISGVLNSYAQKACHESDVECDSMEEVNKFMTAFNRELNILLDRLMPQVLNNKSNIQESLGPKSYLDNVFVSGHADQFRGL
ncbi:ankyrin repeat domain-containing protein [Wolbachia pipientis]|uniref:ankyrin repeat domain-containing protein n=1 Tax=Wolbachia endosymbiont of Drosophila willistoni TaxID=295084 RepID=UPI0032B7CB15